MGLRSAATCSTAVRDSSLIAFGSHGGFLRGCIWYILFRLSATLIACFRASTPLRSEGAGHVRGTWPPNGQRSPPPLALLCRATLIPTTTAAPVVRRPWSPRLQLVLQLVPPARATAPQGGRHRVQGARASPRYYRRQAARQQCCRCRRRWRRRWWWCCYCCCWRCSWRAAAGEQLLESSCWSCGC